MSSSPSSAASVPPALLHPEPTGDALVRAANAVLRRRRSRPRRPAPDLPGLDVAALGRRYGGDPANTKQTRVGVFRAPLGASWDRYRAIRDKSVAHFLRVLEAKGYRLIPRRGAIRVAPGLYPATDPATGAPMLGHREFRVEVDCSYPTAEPVLVQLDPEDVAPIAREKR